MTNDSPTGQSNRAFAMLGLHQTFHYPSVRQTVNDERRMWQRREFGMQRSDEVVMQSMDLSRFVFRALFGS